jgi:hypothetical protein
VVGVLAAAVLFAGQWELAATATAESRAGESPMLGQQTSDPMATSTVLTSRAYVAQLVRPVADLSFLSADTTLRLDYGPRIFWQTPRPVDDLAPLILHVASLSLTTRTDRSVSFSATGTGSLGKPDYSALTMVLGTTQATIRNVSNIASGSLQATTTVRASALVGLVAGVRVFRFQMLDIPDGFPPNAVTSQTVLGFDPSATVRLSPIHRIALESSVAGAWYSTGVTYLTITPNAVWTMRLDPSQTLRVQLGASHARPYGGADLMPPPRVATSPVGTVGLDAVVSKREGVVFRLNADTGINVVFDPVLGTADPRALARAGASLTVAPEWMFALRGDFSTSVDPPAAAAAFVTTYSATASARRLVSSNVVVELGAFFSDRGPALNASNFAFTQPSRWVYLMFTASTRAMGRFAQ